jgi:RNA polymerase sigma factor FliA
MQDGQTVMARDELIVEYQEYVINVGKYLSATMELPPAILDDLIASGYLGLVEAAERYDCAQGRDFKSFAFYRIRGAMIDSLRRTSDFSGRAYRVARALDSYESLKEEFRHSTDQAKRKEKGRRLSEILNIAAEGALAYRLSFAECELEKTCELVDEEHAEKKIIDLEDTRHITKLVEFLPEKERIIVEEYYYNGLSFAEITQKYPELSNKSWVSKLHKRAMEKLRHMTLKDWDE